ncbi:polysaccharide biosynthesis tyrosine autokinase [Microbacterium sp. LRZ72]|uniref:polysaccharide biosynthesis tyrosine autokinase n=1 Tax=Microbacterium sp. LRZ72 TaxID=2942481 RepID=UPI0029ACD51E|nr:polysaccharide biosynthesis tyrosine autokinase [Microbacterium sp. LRZ72]MDX2376588.1 polysaccharide biosynthesis tyrosine autokinase [Microbacterium sp. LRZ72]
MGTRDYARIFRRSWLLIVIFAMVGATAAWAVTATTEAEYSATSAAFVASESGGTLNELTQGNAFTERRVNTYAQLLVEPIVTESVIEDFGLEISPAAFAGQIGVSIPVDTTMLEVTVTDASPSVAASLANALITSLATVVEEIETTAVTGTPTIDANGDPVIVEAAPPVQITQVRFAETPTSPVSPSLMLNLLIGIAAGFALGVLAAILRDLIDTRVRTLEDVEAITTAPIVGAIPQVGRGRQSSILAEHDPGSPSAESFRILRTNLQFLDIDGPATFVLTSPSSGEGKSTITTNLATSIAANGVRVLVVEADLRRPQVHSYFGLEGGAGLTDILIGRAELADVVQSWRSPNLHVLASGRIPPNPSELLGSQQMRELMVQLQERYDVVLYDTPPVLPVPDAAILSRNVGGVLLVASIDRTRRDEIRSAVAALQKVNAHISGVVVNRVAGRGTTSYLAEPYHSQAPAPKGADDASAERSAPPPAPTFDDLVRTPGGAASEDLPDGRTDRERTRRSARASAHDTSP